MTEPNKAELAKTIETLTRENQELHALLNDDLRSLRETAMHRAMDMHSKGAIEWGHITKMADTFVDYVWPGAREALKE